MRGSAGPCVSGTSNATRPPVAARSPRRAPAPPESPNEAAVSVGVSACRFALLQKALAILDAGSRPEKRLPAVCDARRPARCELGARAPSMIGTGEIRHDIQAQGSGTRLRRPVQAIVRPGAIRTAIKPSCAGDLRDRSHYHAAESPCRERRAALPILKREPPPGQAHAARLRQAPWSPSGPSHTEIIEVPRPKRDLRAASSASTLSESCVLPSATSTRSRPMSSAWSVTRAVTSVRVSKRELDPTP